MLNGLKTLPSGHGNLHYREGKSFIDDSLIEGIAKESQLSCKESHRVIFMLIVNSFVCQW